MFFVSVWMTCANFIMRDNFISNAVEKVIDSKISHVALYLGSGLILEATFPRVMIQSVKRYKNYEVYRFPDYVDVKTLVNDCKDKLGVRYGYFQLF